MNHQAQHTHKTPCPPSDQNQVISFLLTTHFFLPSFFLSFLTPWGVLVVVWDASVQARVQASSRYHVEKELIAPQKAEERQQRDLCAPGANRTVVKLDRAAMKCDA